MSKRSLILIAAAISLLFVSVMWQFAEPKIYFWAERVAATILGKPFNQTSTQDPRGIPMQNLQHW
jgi:hypothetical protein